MNEQTTSTPETPVTESPVTETPVEATQAQPEATQAQPKPEKKAKSFASQSGYLSAGLTVGRWKTAGVYVIAGARKPKGLNLVGPFGDGPDAVVFRSLMKPAQGFNPTDGVSDILVVTGEMIPEATARGDVFHYPNDRWVDKDGWQKAFPGAGEPSPGDVEFMLEEARKAARGEAAEGMPACPLPEGHEGTGGTEAPEGVVPVVEGGPAEPAVHGGEQKPLRYVLWAVKADGSRVEVKRFRNRDRVDTAAGQFQVAMTDDEVRKSRYPEFDFAGVTGFEVEDTKSGK
jgi:hypothetical protein